MRPLSCLAACAFLCTFADVASAEPSLADAKRALEAARARLAESVQRVDQDAPSKADLDAAWEAVAQLKTAIDAGARFEPDDLEYAKAALAARKELRTQREHVEQRRAKVHIYDSRRDIEKALAALDTAVSRASGPDGFEAAKAVAAELDKAIAGGQPFAGQDASFARYLETSRATLARQRRAIEDKAAALAAQKQKAEVEEARRALSAALGELRPKDATDAQFEAADKAATALSSLLDAGKRIEADAGYRAYAEQARGDVKAARVKIEAAWSETGLARLKAELEPARADLAAAGRALRGPSPNVEQVAEARTAAIVVGKILEKVPESSRRTGAVGAYVAEVSKGLAEVQVELEKRSLDASSAELKRALRGLEGRAPTEEQLGAASAAASALEKAVAAANLRLPEVAERVRTLRKDVASAKETVDRRRLDGEIDRQRGKIEASRGELTDLMAKLKGAKPGDPKFGEVENVLEGLRRLLMEGTPLTKKDAKYAQYDRDVRKWLGTVEEKLGARRDEAAAERQKAKAKPALDGLARAMSAIEGRGATAASISAAETALASAQAALEEGADVEGRIAEYGKWAKEQRKGLETARVKIAKQKVEVAGGEGRAQLEPLFAAAKTNLDAAKRPDASDAEVTAATQSVKSLREWLERNAALEKQHRPYAEAASRARSSLGKLDNDLELATQGLAFRKATLVLLSAGDAAAEEARRAQDVRIQKQRFEKAVSDYKSCQRSGERLLEESPAIAGTPVFVESKKSAPKDLLTLCGQRVEAIERELKQAAAIVAFDDGPRKHYERAKVLVSKSDRSGALADFDECISSGKILLHRSPDLKDKKFKVGGASMTLSEVVDTCVAEAKRLRAGQ